MVKHLFVVFFSFLFVHLVDAQPIRINLNVTEFLYFVDYERNQLVVLADSQQSYTYDLNTGLEEKRKYTFVSDESFDFFIHNYTPVFEKNQDVLFIDHGCGRVYQWRNDSVLRIDASFHHKNQFANSTIYDQGKVYLYGGYGFFQCKNIITTYDKEFNEWNLYDVQGTKPFVTPYFYSFFSDGVLTVFNFKDVNSKTAYVYQLKILSRKWRFLGKINLMYSYSLFFPTFQANLDFLISEKKLALWDNESLTLKHYNIPKFGQFRILHSIGDKILVLGKNVRDKPYYFLIYNKTDLLTKVIGEAKIEKEARIGLWYIPLVVLILISMVLIILMWFKKRKKRAALYCFNKPVLDVILYWINKDGFQIELSELNDFVSYDNPSLETLKKRRELILKSLQSELQGQFKNLNVDPIDMSSHHQDRRIKVLTLNAAIASELIRGEIREK